MSRFRSLVVPLTAVWLSVHPLVTTGTVIVAFTSEASDIVCTCAHGADHGSCPMHRAPADAKRCRLRGMQDHLTTAILSVLAPLVLPITLNVATAVAPSHRLTGYALPSPVDWIVPPEPPPPRR